MNADNWREKNKRYEGISFTNTDETKTIAGYKSTKAEAKLVMVQRSPFITPQILFPRIKSMIIC